MCVCVVGGGEAYFLVPGKEMHCLRMLEIDVDHTIVIEADAVVDIVAVAVDIAVVAVVVDIVAVVDIVVVVVVVVAVAVLVVVVGMSSR